MRRAFPAFFVALAILAVWLSTFNNSHEMVAIFNSIFEWCEGGPGTLVATILLLGGGAIGVAHCGPVATLAGVVGAALIHFTPYIPFMLMGLPTPPVGAEPVKHPAVQVVPAIAPAVGNPVTKALK